MNHRVMLLSPPLHRSRCFHEGLATDYWYVEVPARTWAFDQGLWFCADGVERVLEAAKLDPDSAVWVFATNKLLRPRPHLSRMFKAKEFVAHADFISRKVRDYAREVAEMGLRYVYFSTHGPQK